MTAADCFCRGAGLCEDCSGHTCAGLCTCDHDGAPQTQAEVTSGHVNPSTTRLDAWTARQELRR